MMMTMRVFLYLLAVMTGLSVAGPSSAALASPAAVGSSAGAGAPVKLCDKHKHHAAQKATAKHATVQRRVAAKARPKVAKPAAKAETCKVDSPVKLSDLLRE